MLSTHWSLEILELEAHLLRKRRGAIDGCKHLCCVSVPCSSTPPKRTLSIFPFFSRSSSSSSSSPFPLTSALSQSRHLLDSVSLTMEPLVAALIGSLFGLFLHHAVFINGEWHVQAPDILICHFTSFVALFIIVDVARYMVTGYILSISTSMVLYRIYFHRLSHFPGPCYARISKIWHAWHSRHRQNYRLLMKLHHQYGDFVRTGTLLISFSFSLFRVSLPSGRSIYSLNHGIGPGELTIFHPDVFMAIDGPQGGCVKSEWYDLLQPKQSLVTARDKEAHGLRRRQWNRGFTPQGLFSMSGHQCISSSLLIDSALDQYQERILPLLSQLERCIDQDIDSKKVTEATDLIYWLGFDRMGDFVFSQTFNMLSRQEWHHIIMLMQRALSLLGPLSPVPWFIQIAFKVFPRVWILKDWFRMVAWCEEQMLRRLEVSVSTVTN